MIFSTFHLILQPPFSPRDKMLTDIVPQGLYNYDTITAKTNTFDINYARKVDFTVRKLNLRGNYYQGGSLSIIF